MQAVVKATVVIAERNNKTTSDMNDAGSGIKDSAYDDSKNTKQNTHKRAETAKNGENDRKIKYDRQSYM